MAHIETRVLRPTNPSGALSASGGAANRIAVFSGASTLGTSANFTYNTSTESLTAGDSASSSSVHSFNGRALSLTYNVSGGDANISIAHNQNTASSGAGFVAQVAGGSAGDAYMIYTVVAATQWIHGIDNSASDTFKLSYGNALGTNDFLQVNTSGKFTIGAASGAQLHDVNGRGFNVVYTTSGVTAYVQASHTSNTANSGVCYYLQVAGANASDPSITFDVSGITQWSVGCDNSNSDAFSISRSTTLGTTQYLQIATTGVSTFAGPIGIEAGAGTDTMLRVRGNSATSGVNQWGIIADTIFASSATSSGYTITAQVQTAASAFTVNRAAALQVAAASLGAGSSVTRLINLLLSEQTAGTNNASVADNIAFSGNWFINSSSTASSLFSGTMNISVAASENLILTKSNNQPVLKFEGGSNDWTLNIGPSGEFEFNNNAASPQFIVTQSGDARLVGGLGVGFATGSVSTLGTVTHRIPVHDTAGVLLGYAPLYDSIT